MGEGRICGCKRHIHASARTRATSFMHHLECPTIQLFILLIAYPDGVYEKRVFFFSQKLHRSFCQECLFQYLMFVAWIQQGPREIAIFDCSCLLLFILPMGLFESPVLRPTSVQWIDARKGPTNTNTAYAESGVSVYRTRASFHWFDVHEGAKHTGWLCTLCLSLCVFFLPSRLYTIVREDEWYIRLLLFFLNTNKFMMQPQRKTATCE